MRGIEKINMEERFLVVLLLLILSNFTATIKQSDSGIQNTKVVLGVWNTQENGNTIFSLTDTIGKMLKIFY